MVVDSHCHLDYDVFDEDRQEMMARAKAYGIDYMLTISVKLETIAQILEIAEDSPHIFASVGIHPHHVLETQADYAQQLETYCQHPKVIGLGETGLDYYYNQTGYEQQEAFLRTHIHLARQFDLPVIIHTRDAEADTIRILKDEKQKGDYRLLIHCFSGSQALADACLEMGAYLSISGIVTFKKSDELRHIVKHVPLERLLVETDSPYLAPMPHRGKRNEPAFTKYTLEMVAQLHNIAYEKADQITTDNFFKLFTKAYK